MNRNRFEGKVALVTGAGSPCGIGRATALASATGLLIARALVQLLTHVPNLLSDAAPYFIGIAPGIDRFVVARKGL